MNRKRFYRLPPVYRQSVTISLRVAAAAIFLLITRIQPVIGEADPFQEKIRQASSQERVVMILNEFDYREYSPASKKETFQRLAHLKEFAGQADDELLDDYLQLIQDTFEKNNPALTNPQKAVLFLNVGRKTDNIQIAGVCKHFAGLYYYLAEDYGNAFENLIDANGKFQQAGYANVPGIYRYLSELGTCYYHVKEYTKAIELLEEAMHYPAFNQHVAMQTPNTLGLCYRSINALESAEDARKAEFYFHQALQVAKANDFKFWIGLINGNLSRIFLHQHRYRESIEALKLEYRMAKLQALPSAQPDFAALDLSRAYLMIHKTDSCNYYLADSRTLFLLNNKKENDLKKLENERYVRNYCDVARLYYQSIHDLPNAYRYLDSMAVLEKRINKRYNSEQISLVEQRLLIRKHQQEVQLLEDEKSRQRILFWIAAVVLTLIAGLFWRLYRSSGKQRRQEKMINTEREKSLKLEKQLVEKELDQANHDLAVFMDNLRERNTLIDTITAQLQAGAAYQPSKAEQQNTTDLISELNSSSILTSKDWEEFRLRFTRVYPDFLAQLHVQFNSLTPAEERILALSKLNMDTRQMGRILGVSAGTIRTTKYRLRKRLNADAQSVLAELLG